MKLAQLIVMSLMLLGSIVVTAQTAPVEKAAPAKKSQSRAEFYDNLFKMFKAHKQEQKDLQIQFINKQFNQELEHQKAVIDIQKQLNPKGTPESNKVLLEQLDKKNKEYQAKSKVEADKFYSTTMNEKAKAFFDKAQKMTKDFDNIK